MRKEISAVLESPDKMVLKEFPIPDIGTDAALLKVEAVGVCGSDPRRYHGAGLPAPVFPIIMGHEIAGRIEEIGEVACRAYGVNKGDRVIVESVIRCGRCYYCLTGDYQQCDAHTYYGTAIPCDRPPFLWGAYGQYMYVAPGSVLHKISEGLPDEIAVCICAVLANGVRWVGQIGQARIGSSVVIQGVGQQGLANIIGAKESGARPIVATGLSADEERFKLAKEFGADYIVNTERDDVFRIVRDLTNGRMADIVVDVTGNPTALETSLKILRKKGILVYAGLTGNKPIPVAMNDLVMRELHIQGAFAQNFVAVEQAVKLAESRKYPIEKMVTHKFTLDNAKTALQVAEHGEGGMRAGKVVIVP